MIQTSIMKYLAIWTLHMDIIYKHYIKLLARWRLYPRQPENTSISHSIPLFNTTVWCLCKYPRSKAPFRKKSPISHFQATICNPFKFLWSISNVLHSTSNQLHRTLKMYDIVRQVVYSCLAGYHGFHLKKLPMAVKTFCSYKIDI